MNSFVVQKNLFISFERVCLGFALLSLIGLANAQDASKKQMNQQETVLIADEINGQTDQTLSLQGKVQITRGNQKILSPSLTFDANTDVVNAAQGVVFYQDKDVLQAPRLKLNLTTGECSAPDVKFFYSKYSGRGSASQLYTDAEKRSTLTEVKYTNCQPLQDDWYLKAKTIVLDNATETGYAKNVVFTFFDTPVLALPYFEFPLGSDNRTGLLAPMMGYSSGTGIDITIPFNINLSHNYDALLNARVMGRRGVQFGLNGRYLMPQSNGDFNLELLPYDKVLSEKRWSIATTHYYKNSDFDAGYRLERVSDNNYFTDLNKNIGIATQSHIPTEAWINYKPYWGSLSVRAVDYQTLQDSTSSINIPYARLPVISLGLKPMSNNYGKLDFLAGFTQFVHPTEVQGSRTYVAPNWTLNIPSTWNMTQIQVGLNSTRYDNLHGNAYTGSSTMIRTLPKVALDSTVQLERPTTWFDTPVLQTLEPRLYYLYVPFKDQADLPNFDSSISDFSFAQIFSDNVFNGLDRIADANHLTAAVTSRWIGRDSSEELFKLTFGKRYYFTKQRVQLSGNSLTTQSGASDWLMAASGSVAQNFKIESAIQYDQLNNETVKNTLSVTYKPADKKFVSLSKRLIKGAQDQYDLSWQWRLSASTAIMGRLNYSNSIPSANVKAGIAESLLGYEYDAGCWVFRIAANRYTTSSNTKNTNVYFQIDFSGFSHIGANTLNTIKRNIPGYTPFEGKTTWNYDPATTD